MGGEGRGRGQAWGEALLGAADARLLREQEDRHALEVRPLQDVPGAGLVELDDVPDVDLVVDLAARPVENHELRLLLREPHGGLDLERPQGLRCNKTQVGVSPSS